VLSLPDINNWGFAQKIMIKRTVEQRRSVAYGNSGRSFKIEAGPGTGKTFTLTDIANEKAKENPNASGLYLAFNSDIVKEARLKMPSIVKSKTGNGLAFDTVGKDFGDRINQRISGRLVADYLKISQCYYGQLEITPFAMGGIALDTVARYCQSSDTFLNKDHIPWNRIPINDDSIKEKVIEHAIYYATKLWNCMSDRTGSFPSTHDIYLKLWALDRPRLGFDFILFDEAQDANSVILEVLLKQKQLQLIVVGNEHQAIYEWRGAVNAMAQVNFGLEAHLTQSFRFGEPIAHVANQILKNFKNTLGMLKGFEGIDSQIAFCEKPDAIISRTNSVLVGKLMEQLSMNRRVGLAKGAGPIKSLLSGIDDLKENRQTQIKELSLFRSYKELVEYSETPSGGDLKSLITQVDRYGIKTLLNALSRVGAVGNGQPKDDFDVILTTAHKSKGLEWKNVVLTDDFLHPGSPNFTSTDANLLFVASTRAQETLDITGCEAAKMALSGQGFTPISAVSDSRLVA